MKTFDLNNYGVQELNAVEMRETNGGSKVWDAIKTAVGTVGEWIGEAWEWLMEHTDEKGTSFPLGN